MQTVFHDNTKQLQEYSDSHSGSLSAQIQSITTDFHDKLQDKLDRLSYLLLDSDCNILIPGISNKMDCLRKSATDHLFREKEIVFELIRAFDGCTELTLFHCQNISNPISMMRQEHTALRIGIKELGKYLLSIQAPEQPYTSFTEFNARIKADFLREETLLFPSAIA